MPVQDVFSQIMLFSLSCLFLVQVIILAVLVFIFRSVGHLKQKQTHLEKHLGISQTDILKHANRRAGQILESAGLQAENISQTNKEEAQIVESAFDKQLQHITGVNIHTLQSKSSDFQLVYEKALENLKQDYLDHFSQLTGKVEKSLEKHTGEFEHKLEEETSLLQKQVAKKIQGEYERVSKNLQEYESAQQAKLEEQFTQKVNTLAKQILPGVIDDTLAQQLVKQALQTAKEKGVLS